MNVKMTFIYSLLFMVPVSAMGQNYTTFEPTSSRELIEHWKNNYTNQSIRAFTFAQETIRFKDSLPIDTSIWYEAIHYPDKFRIDFSHGSEGNINLWCNDSVYVLREGTIKHQGIKVQEALILKGALYFLPVDTTLAKLVAIGVDTSTFHKSVLNDRPAYVVGAPPGDNHSPQIWLDAERRNVIKRISQLQNGKILEAEYGDFVQIDGHWLESWVAFYLDGQLIQTERYQDIQIRTKLPANLFDPAVFYKFFWY